MAVNRMDQIKTEFQFFFFILQRTEWSKILSLVQRSWCRFGYASRIIPHCTWIETVHLNFSFIMVFAGKENTAGGGGGFEWLDTKKEADGGRGGIGGGGGRGQPNLITTAMPHLLTNYLPWPTGSPPMAQNTGQICVQGFVHVLTHEIYPGFYLVFTSGFNEVVTFFC